MASLLLYHVIGDLTVGKPDLSELLDSAPLDAAARSIAASPEGAVAVWCRGSAPDDPAPAAAGRFVGMLTALDLVSFLARAPAGDDAERLMRTTPVSAVVEPNPGLLREVDPGTRLIDALEMMKQGVMRLLVRKNVTWKGISKRFSLLFNGKWLKNIETSSSTAATSNTSRPSSSSNDKFCCLSREDVVRFLIGHLGALAPRPLSSISSLGAINPHYSHIGASSPALEAIHKITRDLCAIAVVEENPDGSYKVIGDISAYKLWKCDYPAAAWAMANLSAGQFVVGADESRPSEISVPGLLTVGPQAEEAVPGGPSPRSKKFSSRSIGFFSNHANQMAAGRSRSVFRGRSAPLTCKSTSSLAAVMAQMLSYRATHVWVTDAGSSEDEILLGVVGYTDILHAVTRNAPPAA